MTSSQVQSLLAEASRWADTLTHKQLLAVALSLRMDSGAGPVESNLRVTDTGDVRVTDTGDRRVTR